ncbi:MAG: hypothetical protein QXI12_04620 [Candidatus Methanomethyliaceae archaeon]
MPTITVVYYIMAGWTAALLVANLIKTKDDIQSMTLYLLVLTPIILRLCRIN